MVVGCLPSWGKLLSTLKYEKQDMRLHAQHFSFKVRSDGAHARPVATQLCDVLLFLVG